LEKIRDHVQYERAIMAVRFTDYFVGTQFHPEADPVSLFPILEIRRPKKKIKSMKGEKNSKLCLKTWMMTRSETNETLIQFSSYSHK
jgi:aspartyl/asparaginyl beta-hydroxylase (cupin superfamily)